MIGHPWLVRASSGGHDQGRDTNIAISELENERDLIRVLRQGYPDVLTSKRHLESGYRNQIPFREPWNTLSETIEDFSHGDVSTRGKITLLNPNKSSAE
jgi:hypothetical protein